MYATLQSCAISNRRQTVTADSQSHRQRFDFLKFLSAGERKLYKRIPDKVDYVSHPSFASADIEEMTFICNFATGAKRVYLAGSYCWIRNSFLLCKPLHGRLLWPAEKEPNAPEAQDPHRRSYPKAKLRQFRLILHQQPAAFRLRGQTLPTTNGANRNSDEARRGIGACLMTLWT